MFGLSQTWYLQHYDMSQNSSVGLKVILVLAAIQLAGTSDIQIATK